MMMMVDGDVVPMVVVFLGMDVRTVKVFLILELDIGFPVLISGFEVLSVLIPVSAFRSMFLLHYGQ